MHAIKRPESAGFGTTIAAILAVAACSSSDTSPSKDGAPIVAGTGGWEAGSGGHTGTGGASTSIDANSGKGGGPGIDANGSGGAGGVDASATGGRPPTGGSGTGGRLPTGGAGGSGTGGRLSTGGAGGSNGPVGTGGASTGGRLGLDGGTALDGAPVTTYLLPADRATSWNLAGTLTIGGVPSASWPICNSTPLAPSGGADDSAQINAKIASCPLGSVVMLGPGTFKMGQGKYVLINRGVVVRGSGAGVTVLRNPLNGPATTTSQEAADTTPIVIIGAGRWVGSDGDGRCNGLTSYQTKYMQLLSADAAKGATSVTVADGAIFKAGQFVLLDETSNASWQPDVVGRSTSVWATPDYSVQWNLHKPAASDDMTYAAVTPSSANNWAGIGNGSDAPCWNSRQDRPQSEIKEVASVSGNIVTFTSPLHKAYRVANHAELTTATGDNLFVTRAGLESLSVVGGGDGGVHFNNAAYSWAKNIEVTTWYGEGVGIDGFRTELRDSYIHDAAWPQPGGAGYAVDLGGSEQLVENNIVMKANKVMVARSAGAGSVVAYNYMDDGYIATTEGWIEIGLNASHMVGPHHVLFEGNQSFNMDNDDTHGNSTYMTYFRNWSTTVRAKFQSGYTGNTIDDATSPNNGPRRAAAAMAYNRWMSFVGNILGQSGVTTAANGYVDESDNMSVPGAIWMLGWNDIAPYTADPGVKATALRDGNWDWLLEKQTWLSTSATTLPDSLYLSGRPSFFGTNPWPWVDPSSGKTYTLPARARLDAGTPNLVP
jgi:hypothetical protein